MIQMVNTINRTNFSGRKVVSCGPAIARAIVPRSRRRSMSCTANRFTGPPDDLFQQAPGASDKVRRQVYIQAVGGAERLARLTGLSARGPSLCTGGFRARSKSMSKLHQRTTITHQELGKDHRAPINRFAVHDIERRRDLGTIALAMAGQQLTTFVQKFVRLMVFTI